MVLQITIFDHRGCARVGKEYLGEKSNTQDDEMMVKVAQTQLNVASNAFTELANAVLAVCAVCAFSRCIVVLACMRALSRGFSAALRGRCANNLGRCANNLAKKRYAARLGRDSCTNGAVKAWVWALHVDARGWMAEGPAPHDQAAACWPGCSRLASWWGGICRAAPGWNFG